MKVAALASSVLVLPLLILEALHTTLTRQNAPGLIVLFGLLWLLPALFVLILRTSGYRLLRVAALLAIALFWGGVVADQMPCFLGVPNCD